MNESKPGMWSTEFWMSVLVAFLSTYLLVKGAITKEEWMVVVTGSNVGYALSRGIAKFGGK